MSANVTVLPSATVDAADRQLVRIVIVGHVDHGKSTLIGRLLHETGGIPAAKIEHLKAISARRGMPFEWSFLLDSLQAERDQGITIDTSQIRFRTPSRDIILIDAPGHAEFLRNMITGASQADAALLLIDAAEGVRDQTRRHGYLLHLLGVRQVTVVVNKMDRVDYDEAVFRAIESEITAYLAGLGVQASAVIPISAREGDGVAERGTRTPWFTGPTVLEALDQFEPARAPQELALRMPVQAVYKFDDRRIVAGRIETGNLAVGQEIVFQPSGKVAVVKTIETWPVPPAGQELTALQAGNAAALTLDREIFVERGEILSVPSARPRATRRIRVRLFWLAEEALEVGTTLIARLATSESRATVAAVHEVVDPGHLSTFESKRIGRNQVGEVELLLSRPIAADPHRLNPRTGRIALELGGRIAGGGLVISVLDGEAAQPAPAARHITPVASAVTPEERLARFGHGGAVVWLTGLSGSGKSTLARALERRLFDRGALVTLLDGDTLRAGLNSDLGFSDADRAENNRRLGEVANLLKGLGHVVLVAAVSPSAQARAQVRAAVGPGFFEVHVSAPLELCEQRDPKGLYAKARAGEIRGFTGIDAPYEAPVTPELVVETDKLDLATGVDRIEALLAEAGVFQLRPAAADDTGL
ncbi:bifunctional enzyme CysN/CysC [Angulomicrobium tetraedrale]|uniref:Adenylyl-sulfate kinase n=1 Tax=Ancylobacter tetraedralis TaxID=217068 RepID=A0A839Z2Y9_9HYPH|nr:adenylyl-sulfate kinase [Ancylobacter tetraedralis]MBB3771074.1 bifunctional enzyme CysN/CysC [Ancylobacter tetraedralis]